MGTEKKLKRETQQGSFPWSDLDHDLRCVIISKVAPDDISSLVVAITFPWELHDGGSPFDDALWQDDYARKYLSSSACKNSDILAAAGLFDFEASCEKLYKGSALGPPTGSFHRECFAGYTRTHHRDLMRLVELGSFKRRCKMLFDRNLPLPTRLTPVLRCGREETFFDATRNRSKDSSACAAT